MSTIEISAADYELLLAAKAESVVLKQQLDKTTTELSMWKFRAENLRQQLYEERLHKIMGSEYLHDLDRGDKTITTQLPSKPCMIPGNKLFIKPGVVSWNDVGNEASRRASYRQRFEKMNTLEERKELYYIKACEKAVKEAFKSNGWLPIWGQEFFQRPQDEATIQKMRKVFLETTEPFTVKPPIDQMAPYPTQEIEEDVELKKLKRMWMLKLERLQNRPPRCTSAPESESGGRFRESAPPILHQGPMCIGG
jgi:hypothetical protein